LHFNVYRNKLAPHVNPGFCVANLLIRRDFRFVSAREIDFVIVFFFFLQASTFLSNFVKRGGMYSACACERATLSGRAE
jgi:hypothetical protein